MRMKTVLFPAILVVLLGVSVWNRPAAPASAELVDLEVKDVPLHRVLSLLEAKTGQHIVAGSRLDARITLSMQQQSLDVILEKIAAQAGAVSTVVVPIYGADSSLRELTQWFREGSPAEHWSEAARKVTRGTPAPFALNPANPATSVSVDATGYSAAHLAPIISETVGAQFLLEDHVDKKVTLTLFEDSIDTAAQALARRLGKRWTRLHVLQPRPAELAQAPVIEPRYFAANERSGTNRTVVN